METSGYAIEQLSRSDDFILIQEHWYFDCQLNRLNAVCDNMPGVEKTKNS